MRTSRRRIREIGRYFPSRPDYLTGKPPNRDLIRNGHLSVAMVLDLMTQRAKLTREVFPSHGRYDTGVGSVEIEINFMCSCIWMTLSGSSR